MTTDNTVEFNFDVIDVNIEDIEDLPSFDPPPNGTYSLLVSAGTKTWEGKDGKDGGQAVVIDYEILGTVQLADPTSTKPPVDGSKFNEMFGLNTEDGIKYLKRAVLPYATHFSTNNIRSLVTEKIQNCVITATVKSRGPSKKAIAEGADPDRRFVSVSNIVLA